MNETTSPSQEWDPLSLLFDESSEFPQSTLVVLNCPILLKPNVVCALWNRVTFRLTVDGGTNRWFKFIEGDNEALVDRKFPHLITGDMDSIEPDLLIRCQKENVEIVNTPLQNKTDFHKGLECIASPNYEQVDTIFVLAEHSGRIDQSLSNLHTLHKTSQIFNRKVRVYILASDTVTWLLGPGVHKIHIADRLIESHAYCALVPLGKPAKNVTTTGLKWNLNNDCLEFGKVISTSNTYSGSSIVTVETDQDLIWSMSLGLEKS